MDFVSWSWGFEFGFRVSGLGVCVGFMFFFSGLGVCVSGFVVSKVCGVSGIEFSVSGLVGCDVSGLGSSVCIFWSRAFCVGVGVSACLVSGLLVSDLLCGFWSRVFCLSFLFSRFLSFHVFGVESSLEGVPRVLAVLPADAHLLVARQLLPLTSDRRTRRRF